MPVADFSIRRALPSDAAGIVSLLETIAAEHRFTAITNPWSAQQQEHHIETLSSREAIHVAEDKGTLRGYQVLELWAPTLASMSHVGQIGTFIGREWRGKGVGQALFHQTRQFAQAHGYAKFVIQVRVGNTSAQSFYQRLGFNEAGRLSRQVRINDVEEDEIIMEMFL